MTFSQQNAAQNLILILARLEIPDEHGETGDDAVLRAIEDASTLYGLIEEARDILRSKFTSL